METALAEIVEDAASSKGRSRLAKRLHGGLPQASALMQKFANHEWMQVSEAMFTKITSSLSLLHKECGAVGEDEATTTLALEWSDGLQAGKSFIKAWCAMQSACRDFQAS